MKKLFALFFLLALSFQVLPVKELGAFIAKGTFTEEIPVSINEDHVPKNICVNFRQSLMDLLLLASLKAEQHLQLKEEVPFSFIGDIFSPPPNA